MPLRRRKRMIEEAMEIKFAVDGEPMGSAGLLGLIEYLMERVWVAAKVLMVGGIMVAVSAIALQFQVTSRNRNIDRVTDSVSALAESVKKLDRSSKDAKVAAEQARKAADQASTDLSTAIASSREQGQSREALAAVFKSVFRIDCTLNHTPDSCAAVKGAP